MSNAGNAVFVAATNYIADFTCYTINEMTDLFVICIDEFSKKRDCFSRPIPDHDSWRIFYPISPLEQFKIYMYEGIGMDYEDVEGTAGLVEEFFIKGLRF